MCISPIACLKRSSLRSNLALALAYYSAAELSRWLASTPQNVTPVWPPDGIAVAAVFLHGYGLLPGVLLGSFLANIGAFWNTSSVWMLMASVAGVFGIAVGTTLGTGAGIFGLRQVVSSRRPLRRVSHVVRLLVFVGLLGPVINAAAGVGVLCLLKIVPWSGYSAVWLTWWISNVTGIFIVTPAVISWDHWLHTDMRCSVAQSVKALRRTGYALRSRRGQVLEALAISGLILMVGATSFWQANSLEYMLIPLLIWSTFRFGSQGATLAAVGISAMAILGTVRGLGTFASEDLNQSLMLLQSFIAVTVFTALIVAAVLSERTEIEEKLKVAIADLAIVNQELEHRVIGRTQELDRKNKRLNKTLQELHQAQSQMMQSEKMSSLGQMVAGIAHEINNPVNFIHGNLKYIQDYIQDMLDVLALYQQHYPKPAADIQTELEERDFTFIQKDTQNILASMKIGTERIREIVRSLRNFSRLDESTLKAVDIHEGLESTLLILKHRLSLPGKTTRIHLKRDYGQLPLVECFPGALNQVFMNVLSNAIDALVQDLSQHSEDEPATVTIRTQAVDEWAMIAIADNGIGISESVCEKVFDPFFTTKPVGKGTGMGLSISYQIITQNHGGRLTFDSASGSGTAFLIQIPLKQAVSAQPQ